jgi:cytochrome c oxidase subunit IV
MGLDYTASKRIANKTILILGAITIFEVAFALLGKGYLVEGVEFPGWIVGSLMIILSIVKAYLIVYEFMHMKYEVPGLIRSVLLPTLLLVWAVIAFFYEGSTWEDRRQQIIDKNEIEVSAVQAVKAVETDVYKD